MLETELRSSGRAAGILNHGTISPAPLLLAAADLKINKQIKILPTGVVHTFNPSSWGAEAGKSEFEASLVYRASPRTARVTEKCCLKKTNLTK